VDQTIHESKNGEKAMNTKRAGLILILAIALMLVGVIGYQALKPTQVLAASQSPVGSWTVTVTPDGGESFADIAIFSSDGTVIVMESDGRLGLGVWQKISGNRYRFYIWEYYTEDGTSFQVKVTSTIELSSDKQQYTGPFSVEVYIAGNPEQVGGGGGTAIGVRQHIEP
jgi:hypothetical protein